MNLKKTVISTCLAICLIAMFSIGAFAEEPAKTEPAKAEPAKTEPAKIEPVKAESASTEPAKVEAATEPAKKDEIPILDLLDEKDSASSDEKKAEELLNEPVPEEMQDTSAAKPAQDEPLFKLKASAPRLHEGLRIRFSVGTGYTHMSTSFDGTSLTLTGATVNAKINAGYWIMENFELNVVAEIQAMVKPDLSYEKDGKSEDISDSEMLAIVIGPGFTYNFAPYDFFVGANLGVGGLVHRMEKSKIGALAYPDLVGRTDNGMEPGTMIYKAAGEQRVGFVAQVNFGKDWWVGDHTGLGIQAQYSFHIYPSQMTDTTKAEINEDWVTWMTHTALLMVTATYN